MKLVIVGILICFASNNVWGSETVHETTEESEEDKTIKEVLEILQSEESADRVVNGQKAGYGEYPWMVSLYEFGYFFCGGSIFNEKYIITAAHCMEGSVAYFMQVRAGDHNMRSKDQYEQRIGVRRIIAHPRYKETPIKYDIAILELRKSLKFNDYVKKIEHATPQMENALAKQKRCWLSGFGTISDNGHVSPKVLMEVKSTLRSRKYCKSTVSRRFSEEKYTKDFICTFDADKGGCFGDSGSALLCYNTDDTPYQVGVLSWGPESCLDGLNVYTRISQFKNWIASKTS